MFTIIGSAWDNYCQNVSNPLKNKVFLPDTSAPARSFLTIMPRININLRVMDSDAKKVAKMDYINLLREVTNDKGSAEKGSCGKNR